MSDNTGNKPYKPFSAFTEYNYLIDLMKHAIGLDYKIPYARHGRLYYKAYRNYFATSDHGVDKAMWEILREFCFAQNFEIKPDYYCLTDDGIEYLQKMLGIEKITIDR